MKSLIGYLTLFLTLGVATLFSEIEKDETQLDSGIGYYKVVRVDNTLYISGCTGWGETMEEQFDVAYGKIEERLALYGVGFESVVKENLFTTDLKAAQAAIPHRKEILDGDYFAATWVEVKALWLPEIMVEIEVIAILPDEES